MARRLIVLGCLLALLAAPGGAAVTLQWWWTKPVARQAVSDRYGAPARCYGRGESFRAHRMRFFRLFKCVVGATTLFVEPVSSWRFRVTTAPPRPDVAP